MAWLADALSWLLLLAGTGLLMVSGIGLLRLPDVYCRLHGAGLGDTLGAALVLGGLMAQGGLTIVGVKLLLILVFLLWTSPVASHALAKVAYESGLEPILAGKEQDR